MPRPAAIVRPLCVAAAAVAMLAWTWATWPDPLVDFGTHLYVPWRISAGDVLYRDIAFYNGPFSSYANALVFELFGVGMHVIEAANAVVLAVAMTLAYRLTRRASGPAAAVFGGLTFAGVFAFGQGVVLGNYNWMTPYAHELTHGVTLGLAAMACLDRHLRTGRLRWAAAAGIAVGAACLTKAEPAVAAVAAVAVQLAAGLWVARPPRRRVAVAVVLAAAVAVPVVAVALLSAAMPVPVAVRGVLGSWPWAFDRRITSLAFYRSLSGLDDVGGNLWAIGRWSVAWAAVAGVTVAAAMRVRPTAPERAAPVVLTAAIATLLVAVAFTRVNGSNALLPLPLGLCVALVPAVAAVVRRRAGSPLRLAAVVFALALLGKIVLLTHAYHYGFALVLPGTLVLVAIVADDLPAWVDRRGGRGAVVRAVGLPVWAAFVVFTLLVQSSHLSAKQWTVMAGGPDSFRATARGLEVQAAVDWIDQRVPPSGTVAVFPQGLMVNYLARRATPTRFVNFMPPEVIAAGEAAMLAALQRHPPDAVVIDGSAFRDGQFTLDYRYDWGRTTADWIAAHYRPAERVMLPRPLPTSYGLLILTRK